MALPANTIDAHQHFWELGRFNTVWLEVDEHKPICRNFLPADLRPHLDAAGVAQSIFVQTQHKLDENRWVLELAEQHEWMAGVVGWVRLSAEDCEDQLLEFLGHPKFVGIRHITQDESDDDFIIRPEILRGLRILEKHSVPFDLLFYVKHLKHAATLAKELPSLPMVIDHLAKPEIKDRNLEGWEEHFRAAAEFPNVYCKLSGMVTEADWENWHPRDLKPYVNIALDAFGPQRLMFGSDWPVCELAGSYEQVAEAADICLSHLSDAEREQIFCKTAREFYGIE